MTNELTTTTVKASDRANALYDAIERDVRGHDTLPAPLTATDRKAMQEHRRELHARLRPISEAKAEQDRAAAAVALFLGGYTNLRVQDPAATVRVYIAMMLDQPLFAIQQALEDFQHGRVYDVDREGNRVPFSLDFAPSAPRVLDQVKKRAAPVQEARYKAERVLAVTKTAEPLVSEAERDKVAQLMSGLASTMRVGVEEQRRKDREIIHREAQEARDRATRITEEGRRQRAHAG